MADNVRPRWPDLDPNGGTGRVRKFWSQQLEAGARGQEGEHRAWGRGGVGGGQSGAPMSKGGTGDQELQVTDATGEIQELPTGVDTMQGEVRVVR